MTKSRKSNSGNGKSAKAGPGHNSRARKDVIVSVCREVTALEAERKVLGEQIRTIKTKKIKGDLGMKIGDFNIAFRLYQLEGEARDQLLDTIRETFNAQGVGEQLDWVTASQRAADAVTEHVDENQEAAAAGFPAPA